MLILNLNQFILANKKCPSNNKLLSKNASEYFLKGNRNNSIIKKLTMMKVMTIFKKLIRISNRNIFHKKINRFKKVFKTIIQGKRIIDYLGYDSKNAKRLDE
jgi:2-oxoglutarate dehydrogenase complex dehydrogenase (E1) component-like enzyme